MTKTSADTQIQYLRSNNFLRTWTERECSICEIEGVTLSSDRAPPEVAHRPTALIADRSDKEVPARPGKGPQDPYLNTFNAAVRAADAASNFSAWLKNPLPAPKPRPVPVPPINNTKKVPPFDIQDVPKAMRKLNMPISAKLQERWFAGQANYSRSHKDLQAEIDQFGKRYDPSMVDTTTVTMAWALNFTRAKSAYDVLLKDEIRNPAALKGLRTLLAPYKTALTVDAWKLAGADFLKFHREFQFQRMDVNKSWGDRISSFLIRSLSARGVPDDRTGALGAFNFYAAVQYARIEPSKAGPVGVVTHVSIYVRDPYEFSDEQYLGHWSVAHVAVVPAHQLWRGWLA